MAEYPVHVVNEEIEILEQEKDGQVGNHGQKHPQFLAKNRISISAAVGFNG